MPTNVTPYNIPVPDGTDPVNFAGTSGALAAMATAIGTALDGKQPVYGVLFGQQVITGRWYGTLVAAANNPTNPQDDLCLFPFVIPKAASFDRIAVNITTAAASTTVRLGVYAHDPATENPGALLFDAGTVDSSTTGTKEITISETLAAGIYWFATVSQGGTPALRGSLTWQSPFPTNDVFVGNAANPSFALKQSGVSGALPASVTPDGQTNAFARMALRAA